MKPERWQRINELYYAALEHEESQRPSFVERACGSDEELRQEVEALLAAHNQAGSFLTAPALHVEAEAIAADKTAALLGRQIGYYQMLSLLGAGGMGEVYLAEDTRLGRKIALKFLPREFTQDRERVRRFEREARAASALNHPNIVTIFEIGEVEGAYFIATEFIDGQTLRERLAGSPIKVRELLDMAVQVASALSGAHEVGIMHRDIKPENIMVRRDGYVKVLDFGLAKLIERPSVKDRKVSTIGQLDTDPGKVMGTARYMSPEQIMGRPVDGRTDIFSLGVVLYEMAARREPFEGVTSAEVMAAILNQQPPPLARYTREIPPELERIVSKALAKDREERYQVSMDLLIDLKSLRLELELEARLKRDAPQTVEHAKEDQPPPQPLSPSEPAGPTHPTPSGGKLEPVGGAVALDSDFYIVRRTDIEFHSAIARQDSIVLVKGARQVGKTSLLARGLQKARQAGARVVLTDFQNLSAAYLQSIDKLLLTLAELLADQLELDVFPHEAWNPQLSSSINFERYLRRQVFANVESPIVWGLDEVDWLFTCSFGSEVFGLFRSWHNRRALDPAGPWQRLTLAIAYATEAHLFITDLNQSPFNVGTRLWLEDFTFQQVEELNRRYGSPLRNKAELARYYRLVGGHPYLARRGLHEMAIHGLDLPALEAQADHDEGPFGDHLRRLLLSLRQDAALCEVVRGVLRGQPCPSPESFYRLRSAGLMSGESAQSVKPRCQLYPTYLEKHLL
jgi:serine/threonine protein kinase